MRNHGMGRIAITGASSFLGERFLRRLIREGHADDVVVIDVAEPSISEGSIHFRKVDLTEPAADQAMLDLLKADGIETVVHLAFFTNPRRDTTNAHELESIGTLAVLAAAAAANVKNFVMRSHLRLRGPGAEPGADPGRHAFARALAAFVAARQGGGGGACGVFREALSGHGGASAEVRAPPRAERTDVL